MNDLLTKSFLSYVDLKKQAKMDIKSGPDVEMGKLDPSDELNLSMFFKEVNAVKADMEEISYLRVDLEDLNDETNSAQTLKILKGLRERINGDTVMILKKAKLIKTRLDLLDNFNAESRIDRVRISITNDLKMKLKDIMNDFECLREKIVDDQKEGLKNRYCSITVQQEKENQGRHEAVREILRSLVELHQMFLNMAMIVEIPGEEKNNIEENVVVKGGMKRTLIRACWIGAVVLIFLLVFLAAILL